MSTRLRSVLVVFSLVLFGGVAAPVAEVAAAAEPTTRSLAAVSCPTPTTCFAVGAKGSKPLVQRWNGSSWTVVPSPQPATGDGAWLNDVSCASADRCIATGVRWWAQGGQHVVIEHWNGRAWRIEPTIFTGHSSSAGGVSCAGRAMCVAVGSGSIRGDGGPFALRWNGTTWKRMGLPTMRTPVRLLGVSCPDTRTCVAVGWKQAPLTVGHVQPRKAELNPLALHWKAGSGWAVRRTPHTPSTRASDMLRGVDCPTANRCFAAGWTSNGGHRLLAWNGTKWSVEPVPAGVNRSLMDIACPTATTCFAVGSTTNAPSKTVIERWNGSAWSVTPSPNGARRESLFSGISCRSAIRCFAVGSSWGGSAGSVLRARWDGSHWSRS